MGTERPMIDSQLFPDAARSVERVRLFCFPHAGGGTSQFYRWQRFLGDEVTIVPVRLPGRESRLHEPPVASLDQLATVVARTLAALPPGPMVLLGYSFGAHLAYQVASRLSRSGAPAPRGLIVVASNAPGHLSAAGAGGGPADNAAGQRGQTDQSGLRNDQQAGPAIADLPDAQLIEHIHGKYGGIPAAIRQDPAWLAAVVPALRADLRMLESSTRLPDERLDCPVLALGGSDDAYVLPAGLAAWGAVTGQGVTVQQFPGGHFFLYQDPGVGSALGAASAEPPAALASILDFVQRAAQRQ